MKYIKYFNQETEYNSFLEGEEYIEPHLAFINETNALHFIKKTHKLGDVAYWNGNSVQTCSLEKYNESMGAAIGVVVIPLGFAPDGKARILGLKPMDASGNMTDEHQFLYWEDWEVSGDYVDTTLTNYTVVPITDNVDSTSSESNLWGYLPSDKFTGVQSYVDPEAKYYSDYGYIPSPYLGDTPNPEYYKTISDNNALSDFNGLTNTQTLVGLGSAYQAANACWNYNDGTGSNVQWYLPAMGELGYLMPRFNVINEVITSLGGVTVGGDSRFWSSSELSGTYAHSLDTYGGSVLRNFKSDVGFCVRAFACLK